MTELINQEWYYHLVEECQAILDKAVFNARQEMIEGYWQVGERIVNDYNIRKFAKGNHTLLQDLANNIGMSERNLYYCLKFYTKYPQLWDFLEKVDEGKNISWNKIVTKYLPTIESSPKKPKVVICPHCQKEFEL